MQPTIAASIDRRDKLPTGKDLDRLRRLRDALAERLMEQPVYSPIFLKVDREIALAEAAASDDTLARARAIARQIATR